MLANSRAVNTNLEILGLHLHSSSPKPVNFFGAQSLLGGRIIFVGVGTSSHLGGHGPGMLPRGACPAVIERLLVADSTNVVVSLGSRSYRNFLSLPNSLPAIWWHILMKVIQTKSSKISLRLCADRLRKLVHLRHLSSVNELNSKKGVDLIATENRCSLSVRNVIPKVRCNVHHQCIQKSAISNFRQNNQIKNLSSYSLLF